MDRLKPGFYVRSITDRAPVLKSSDKAFDRLMARIDDDDKRLLLNESESSPVVKSSDSSIKAEVKNDKEAISCTRCRDATYKNKFNASEHPVESMESILSNVDPLGNIIHLVNAFDFPLTLNPALFKFREARDIKIVITKADRLFAHSKTANNYGLTFFRDYLNRKYGILPENVFISSGVVDWNIKELLENIPDNSYFIGDVNVGKSTLIKSLIYGDEKFNKRKFTDKKEKITLEKEQDYLINHSNKKTFSSKKVERKFEESFKAKNGPGVSYMPAFTRGNIRFELQNSGKTIFDVPGIGDENHGVFQWIEDTKAIRQVTKGTKVPKRGSYDSKYFTVKGGQCLTVGGIFTCKFHLLQWFKLEIV